MKHIYKKCHCHKIGCWFCDGGLAVCTVCNGAEGTLTTECCGRPITKDEEHLIYKEGTLDFVAGAWRTKKPTEILCSKCGLQDHVYWEGPTHNIPICKDCHMRKANM
ncbi:MAG: hypothetical protein WC375_11255 [Methanomassiliicoccales archaeon]|jgi:hypothetical protein